MSRSEEDYGFTFALRAVPAVVGFLETNNLRKVQEAESYSIVGEFELLNRD